MGDGYYSQVHAAGTAIDRSWLEVMAGAAAGLAQGWWRSGHYFPELCVAGTAIERSWLEVMAGAAAGPAQSWWGSGLYFPELHAAGTAIDQSWLGMMAAVEAGLRQGWWGSGSHQCAGCCMPPGADRMQMCPGTRCHPAVFRPCMCSQPVPCFPT